VSPATTSLHAVEMTRTRLSPLSVLLYMEVVLTTSNRKNISHSHGSLPYLNTCDILSRLKKVIYHEMTNDHSALVQREGFQKIFGCYVKAKSDGHRFVWIGICCIEKSRSADFSEPINSIASLVLGGHYMLRLLE
jgi:hypothetical protein